MGIIDETVFLKKDTHSAGWRGSTAARRGGWRTARRGSSWPTRGYTLLDAEFYLPEGWTSEPARLEGCWLSSGHVLCFAINLELTQRLLVRAQAAVRAARMGLITL